MAASIAATRPRSAPLAPELGLSDGSQDQRQDCGQDGGVIYQHQPSAHSSQEVDYTYPQQPTAGPTDLLTETSTTPAGLPGFDLSTVSDQLQFPEIPQSLLEEAPEYEYVSRERLSDVPCQKSMHLTD